MSLTPYYDRDGITIFHADCRIAVKRLAQEVLPLT